MKKNKLYIILAILATVFLFITSAVCNQCKAAAPEEGTEAGEEEQEEATTEGEAVTEEETVEGEEEAPAEEEEEEEVVEEEEEVTEGEKEAPTISLAIYEGPTYSTADDVCYYRIKATVTGSPSPTVEFSKDDSYGAWGSRKAQVNLNNPSETYTLTATATNSEGTDTASIALSWGCEIVNQDPVISEITVMGTKYISRTYGLGVSASDLDGDSLTYNWTVTGGTIDDVHAQNINWTTPSTCGNYTISVTVSDGKGGEDSKSEDIYVHFLYDLLEKAPSANWYNPTAYGTNLWNMGLDDARGFACYRTNIKLEDNNTYSKVLETHPQWINNGYIGGEYPDIIKIPEGAKFTASVGFLKDATGTDGVGFVVVFRDTSYVVHYITSVSGYHATYNGALDSLNLDLSSFAGESGQIVVGVNAGASSGQDWAVWVNPQITN
jgi:PKD repeat protein